MNISVNLTNPFVLIFLCGTVATLLINHFLEFIDYRARVKNGGTIPEILQKIPLAVETFDEACGTSEHLITGLIKLNSERTIRILQLLKELKN